jgi:acyl-CoA thioester hydrolase
LGVKPDNNHQKLNFKIMFSFSTNIRVRYAETDQMGYVYYGNYATYYEVARVEMLRSLDFSYKALEASGVMMPVLELKCKYIRPAKYDDLLTINVKIEQKPTTRMIFKYEVFNQENTLLNIGETTLVFIAMKTAKVSEMPTVMKDLLNKYFE